MFEKDGGPSRQLRDRPQLKAARISDGDDNANMTNEPSGEADGRDDWDDGPQWDSATEGEGSLHSLGGDTGGKGSLTQCQGHSSLDAPSELNPPQRIPSLLFVALLVPQAEG